MKNQHDIEHILNNKIPSLDGAEKELLWKNIEMKITEKPILSPFAFAFKKIYMMPAAAFAIILILGVGTSAAAEQSRPGDILFPVERALEEVRLAIATNDMEKTTLQIKYAEERLSEMRSLLEGKQTTPSIATSTIVKFEGEADIFSDITLVKIEINDDKKQFSTQAKSREEIVDEIVNRYKVAKEVVEANLEIEQEDRASRVSDISKDTEDDVRVKKSVELISSLVDEINDDERKRFVREILSDLDDADVRIEVKHDDEDHEEDDEEERIEVRTDSERIRIREKDDGEVRVEIRTETEDNNDGDNSEDNDFRDEGNDDEREDSSNDDEDSENESRDNETEDSDDRDEDERDSSSTDETEEIDDSESEENESISKLEVRVKDDIADVRMEYGHEDLDFKTPFTTEAALIATIALRSGFQEAMIASAIEIEIDD